MLSRSGFALSTTEKKVVKSVAHRRVSIWYGLLLAVFVVFIIRLFYLQVLRHDYYQKVALNVQLKQYDIPAERGAIRAYDGDQIVPLVLNEQKFNITADPKLIKNPAKTAGILKPLLPQKSFKELTILLSLKDSRYKILAKRVSKEQKIAIIKLGLAGIFSEEVSVRTYPQNDLAAQLLGFVNDDGIGRYGVEQSLNNVLNGKSGRLKAITDQKGVPLLATGDNVSIDPIDGKDAVLTIDVGMQRQLEDILKTGLDNAKSKSGSAIIMDPRTGEIKAMANYPTYNPTDFSKVNDPSIFQNSSVSVPLEVGSIMKPLTVAAALDQGVVSQGTTYYDPGQFKVDGATITNIEEDGGAGTKSIADILQLSLNTGATWLLMQMGGGAFNQKGRDAWHEYMVNHYGFGAKTGVEQGYESPGYIPDPKDGYGLNIVYANTAFGQGMTATPLQMLSALGGVVNNGKTNQPHLLKETIDSGGKVNTTSVKSRNGIVKNSTSQSIVSLMEYVFNKNHALYGMPQLPEGYIIGGKTGTAQIAKTGGGYYEDKYNGTFMGFVGGNEPDYVIFVRVNEPGIPGYAGAKTAAPIFSALTTMLINNFNITPGNK